MNEPKLENNFYDEDENNDNRSPLPKFHRKDVAWKTEIRQKQTKTSTRYREGDKRQRKLLLNNKGKDNSLEIKE